MTASALSYCVCLTVTQDTYRARLLQYISSALVPNKNEKEKYLTCCGFAFRAPTTVFAVPYTLKVVNSFVFGIFRAWRVSNLESQP